MEKLTPYTYFATTVRTYDGDTTIVDLDLGLGILKKGVSIRLLGCNAPELNAPGGPEAKSALMSYLPAGTTILLKSVKYDKYGGRLDADIWLIDHAGQQLPGGNVVALLAAAGHVALWDGKGTKPMPPAPTTDSLVAPSTWSW